jgi:hypothetical protein
MLRKECILFLRESIVYGQQGFHETGIEVGGNSGEYSDSNSTKPHICPYAK